MRGGEIVDVDEIADAGAVRGGELFAVDLDLVLLAERDLEHIRNEVGFDAVILAKLLARTGGVEVAEIDVGEAVNLVVPIQHLLEHELRLAVRVDRLLGQPLVHRDLLRCSVGGASGGEDELLHAALDGSVEEIDAGRDVIAEILRGIGHRFRDERIRGEVHDGIRLRTTNGSDDLFAVAKVAFDEGRAGIDGQTVALGKVIENGDLMSCVDEFFRTNTADIPGPSRDENVHAKLKTSGWGKSRAKSVTNVFRRICLAAARVRAACPWGPLRRRATATKDPYFLRGMRTSSGIGFFKLR